LLGLGPHGDISPLSLPSEAGVLALASDASLIIGLEDGLWTYLPESKRLALLTPMQFDRPNMRLNDGKPDRQGRLWFGSMDRSGSGAPVGALYVRQLDGQVEVVRTGVRIPNAIVVSPGGETLYFTDSPSQEVLAFDLDQQTGRLSNERVFYALGGEDKPDGTTVDAEGNIWLAVVHGARIDKIDPRGQVLATIPVPVTKPTMAVFGGQELTDLHVTSQKRFLTQEQLAEQPLAGSLIRVPSAGQGLAANRMQL